MKRILLINIVTLLVLFHCTAIYAHDNIIIHPALTDVSVSKSNVEQYLQSNLNFKDGLKTIFAAAGKQNILQLLKDGSFAEDSLDDCRASNHFLNPTLTWDKAGMSDEPFFVDWTCNSWRPFYSAVTWATGFKDPTITPIQYDSNNEKSPNVWANARTLYFNALTAANQTTRENNFAQMFTALGQVMHLLQDVSVPAHVRNDFRSHMVFTGCGQEKCPDWILSRFNNVFEYYVKINSGLVAEAAASPSSESPKFTNPRLTDFWDTQNPGSTVLGLSQFTNARYLSDETIPNNEPNAEHTFTYPVIDNNSMRICEDYEPGSAKIRKYFSRSACTPVSEARTVDHFATPSLLNKEKNIIPDNISTLRLWLDDNVHKTYAAELLPLAIGYSSELLKYFFRGKMEVKCLPVIKENKISYVKLTIINATLGEAMTNGKLMLTGKYTDSNNEEIIVRAKYGTSDYAVIETLEYGQPLDLNFLFPEGTQIPIDKWDSVNLSLIYQGKLGSEEGAVIGKVFDPGKLNFNEEFTTAPKGDYNWFQMDSPVFGTNICPYHNMEHGVAQNDIVGGKLIKTNIRYPIANPSGLYPGAHLNTSLIGVHNLSGNTYANNIFPIPVTKDTYIEFKIDDMTIAPNTAASGSYTHYQGMVLSFNNGYNLEFSLNNQFWYFNNTTGYFTFNAGYTTLSNIHKMFEQYNLPVPADFKLNYIGLFQQIAPDLPLDTQYEQKMIVDFVRIVDMSNM